MLSCVATDLKQQQNAKLIFWWSEGSLHTPLRVELSTSIKDPISRPFQVQCHGPVSKDNSALTQSHNPTDHKYNQNQNVPQNHKIQKACQLTENKSINVQLKRRDCSKLFNGVEKIHRNGRRWQAFFLEPKLTQNFTRGSERPKTVWSNSPREPIRTCEESRTGMFSKPFLAASESISPFSGPGPCGR